MDWLAWVMLGVAPVAIALGAVPPILGWRFHRYVSDQLKRPTDRAYTPHVCIIAPCKGLDPGFDQNIQALFDQDYPEYHIVFATATEDDPANAALQRIMQANPQVSARVVHAGIPCDRSEKVNNQLRALREIGDAQVLAFFDSDGRPDRGFLQRLVAPLRDEGVGATTGFRWYAPVEGGFGSWLRSVWNAGGITFMANRDVNYTYGGAMALRRDTFDRIGIAEKWRKALSDDIMVTRALREAELPIHYVPSCMVLCEEDSTLSETIEWTSRQTVVARVYMPRFWWTSGLSLSLTFAMTCLGLVALLAAALGAEPTGLLLAGGLLMLGPLVGTYLMGAMALRLVPRLLPERQAEQLRRRAALYFALTPIASLLLLWNTVRSAASRRIMWRGRCYILKSPESTIVLANG